MIVVIDYGLGNVGSLLNMFKKIGVEAVLSSDRSVLESSSHMVLPGVGSFDNGMNNLRNRELIAVLNDLVLNKKTPILGICLGAQLMFQYSEEGNERGLGWINGYVKKFITENKIKVPHMGWNNVAECKGSLFEKMPAEPPRFYFVHSYHFELTNQDAAISYTHYGTRFCSAVQQDNIFGVQFHPEKSHQFGIKLLENFLAYK